MVVIPIFFDLSYIKECLDYDSSTGIFTWKVRPIDHFVDFCAWKKWNTRYSKKVAGKENSKDYNRIAIKHKTYLAHRLAWWYHYGYYPEKHIDHKNGNHLDNSILNLRLCTQAQNSRNAKKPITNKSGYKGVSWDKNRTKWVSYINFEGKKYHLGYFVSIIDAALNREKASIKYHQEFRRA